MLVASTAKGFSVDTIGSDAAVLDCLGAGAGPRAALAAAGCPDQGIQLVGLTLPDGGGPPRWTLYIADQ